MPAGGYDVISVHLVFPGFVVLLSSGTDVEVSVRKCLPAILVVGEYVEDLASVTEVAGAVVGSF